MSRISMLMLTLVFCVALLVVSEDGFTLQGDTVQSLEQHSEAAHQWGLQVSQLEAQPSPTKEVVRSGVENGQLANADLESAPTRRLRECVRGLLGETRELDGVKAARASTCSLIQQAFSCPTGDSGGETGDDSCRDLPEYSQPYEKLEYDTKMKETNYTSRCEYEINASPCETDIRLRKGCAKTCGTGSTDRGYMGLPYVHYNKVVNASTPIPTTCELAKARGHCTYSHAKRDCGKTCGGGEVDKVTSSTTSPHWRKDMPFGYEKKKYSSYCEFHKVAGKCDSDFQHDLYSGSTLKSAPKNMCQKTCTGKGEDTKALKEIHESKIETKLYKTHCEFLVKSMSEPLCEQTPNRYNYRAIHVKRYCAKTCTGKGKDTASWAKPYRKRKPVIKKVHKYTSKCAYIKEAGYCQSTRFAASCRKTCGQCGKDGIEEPEIETDTTKATSTEEKGEVSKSEDEEEVSTQDSEDEEVTKKEDVRPMQEEVSTEDSEEEEVTKKENARPMKSGHG